jgi:CxxC motif-containing protein (DUF1111 family)
LTRRLSLFAAGALLGALLTGAAVLGVREYRRQHRSIDEAESAELGGATFASVHSPASGAGPAFNAGSCAACHAIPGIGGWGTATTLRVARQNANGTVHTYKDGPIVPLFSNPDHECQAVIPADANIFSRRLPISTFGSGLIDAIADDQLVALEDPGDRDGDGIRGRAARVLDRESGLIRIGRFGWKAQQASLLVFAAEAYRHELGVTNELYPADGVIGVSAERVRQCDTVADPEDQRQVATGLRSIDTFVAFMKSLPAPEPPADTSDTTVGAAHFRASGCTTCHRPQVGDAHAWSDFLLHDIGTGDGIPEGDAGPREMRTAALWGIRWRSMYLHDGSAGSIEQAIARHAGEAAAARSRFAALSAGEQGQLVAFVKSR